VRGADRRSPWLAVGRRCCCHGLLSAEPRVWGGDERPRIPASFTDGFKRWGRGPRVARRRTGGLRRRPSRRGQWPGRPEQRPAGRPRPERDELRRIAATDHRQLRTWDDPLLRRHGQTVQACPVVAARWADVPGPSSASITGRGLGSRFGRSRAPAAWLPGWKSGSCRVPPRAGCVGSAGPGNTRTS